MQSSGGETAGSVFIRHGRCCGRPSGAAFFISWAGMRGIVSLAAALALPSAFPYRDLIVLTAFSVVLGTLALQGLTLKPLLRALDLHDDHPVRRELIAALQRAPRAGPETSKHKPSSDSNAIPKSLTKRLAPGGSEGGIS